MSVPALMSGGRTRFLGAKALTFQEEQRKQRWPGGYREGPTGRLAEPSLSDPPAARWTSRGVDCGHTTGDRWEAGPQGPPRI